MNNQLRILYIIFIGFIFNSCGLLGDKVSPAASIEATKTSIGAAIGSVFTIPAAGGTANIVSATAKVTVPSGAMTAALSIQANTDMLDNEGQGIRLSGDWTKPITVEFAIPAGVTDPENYKIALRLDNGYWVTCRKAKINTANNTVQVRIAPSIKTKSARQARPMASSYSLAFAKTFYLKPDRATVKLGEKVKFTAYAREGFIPKELMGKVYDSEVEFEAGLKKLSEAVEEVESNDDDLVPLPNLNAKDDDELVPLTVIAKEVPFTNKKVGFTRTWTAKSLGSIVASGNAGADYTAPKDDASKGKTVKVLFSSINDKTQRKANAEATVRIEDGLTRYTGIITNEYLWQTAPSTSEKENIAIQFEGSFVNTSNFPNIFRLDEQSSKLTVTKYDYFYQFSGTTDTKTLKAQTTVSKFEYNAIFVLKPSENKYEFHGEMYANDIPVLYVSKSPNQTITRDEKQNIILHVNPTVTSIKKLFSTTDFTTLSGKETIVIPGMNLKNHITTWNFKKE
jgi:hypothetical protein